MGRGAHPFEVCILELETPVRDLQLREKLNMSSPDVRISVARILSKSAGFVK